MTTKTLLSATLGVLALASCATREISPMPFASATDCFYPACAIDVEVVQEGGVRKLKIANDGNVRMGTRQRLTAIVWNVKTPGYEFRGDSVLPHRSSTPGAPKTPDGLWDRQIAPHAWWWHSYSVTDFNTEPGILYYELTVYPERAADGEPITVTRAIMNDPGPHPQRRQ